MKTVGTWWSNRNIEIVEVDGVLYALNGWNGEEYTNCWKCIDKYTADGDAEYTLRPCYRWQVEGIDIAELEENSEEWSHAVEVVDFDVY